MNCRRCGFDNPPGARYCRNCSAELMSASDTHMQRVKQQKKNEGIIVALIIILIVILIIATVVLLMKDNEKPNFGSGGGIGGGGNSRLIPHGSNTTHNSSDSVPSVTAPEPEPAPPAEPAPAPQPEPVPVVPQPDTNPSAERLAQKNAYYERISEIELYTELYLDTATTQHDINRESGVVFQKWDELLNDVYQYLKLIMPTSEFNALEDEEIQWIIEKENAIDAAGAQWAGGSAEPAMRNYTAIEYTISRCYYLISLI